jgi:hypothetical protein
MSIDKQVKVISKAKRLVNYGFTREGAILACLEYYQCVADKPRTLNRFLRLWET